MEYPPFPGFRSQAFSFLKDLAKNNDRDWFKERKALFDEELKFPMQCLVVDAARRSRSAKLKLNADPKKSLFRIYRDTRFSKDKSPYKTHLGAVLSPSGDTKEQGGVYIHVEPRNCFTASGYWNPDADLLKKIRTKIARKSDDFLELVEHLDDKDLPLHQHGEGLKRIPRGFEEYAESEVADYLKWKSFIVTRTFTQKQMMDPGFVDEVVQFGTDVLPLQKFVG